MRHGLGLYAWLSGVLGGGSIRFVGDSTTVYGGQEWQWRLQISGFS